MRLWRGLQTLTCLLILKVTISVLMNYVDYLPPDFNAEFLQEREEYFRGSYAWAFYVHLASGPVALVAGLLLILNPVRRFRPALHRRLGKLQVLNVCLLLTPSGLWMAFRASGGFIAITGFVVLALLTALFALQGWWTAVHRQYQSHQRWMWRCYLLLCSAVTLRVIGGMGFLLDLNPAWTYPMAAWISWLGPLAVYELCTYTRNASRQADRLS